MNGLNDVIVLDDFVLARHKLKTLWSEGITSYCPDDAQWNVWIQIHDTATLMQGILKTTKKYRTLNGSMDADFLVRYMSSVANSVKRNSSTNQQGEHDK